MGHMSPRIKVKKGRPLVGFPNQAPLVTITAYDATPSNGVPNSGFTATATDPETGADLSASVVWTGWLTSSQGYRDVQTSSAWNAGTSTGLTVGSPAGSPEVPYTGIVEVDGGGEQAISVLASNAATFGALLTELDADTTGGSWSLVGGEMRCISDKFGNGSTVSLLNSGANPLFSALDNYVSISAGTAGANTTGQLGVGANPTLTFDADGVQNVVASAVDSFGQSGTDSQAVTVS